MRCAAQSWSGLFMGEGATPLLPRLAVASRRRRRLARIAPTMPSIRSSWTLSIAPISSDARAPAPGEGAQPVGAALPVEVAGVDGAAGAFGHRVVRRHDATAFAAGHVLEVVEAERARVADAAELPPLVAAADALAGVLQHEKTVLAGDLHDAGHVAGGAPHVHGMTARVCGPTFAAISAGSMVIEASTSTSTGIAPTERTAVAVAM
jgi:hypothetical protein